MMKYFIVSLFLTICSISLGYQSTKSKLVTTKYSLAIKSLKEHQELSYSWRNKWYAVCFEENLPKGNSLPMAFSLYSNALVLWRDLDNQIRCVEDHCPHRSAKLSEGRIRDGNIECLYHGWQFKGDSGVCIKIPQLEIGASIPSLSCITSYPVQVHEEIIWVYLNPMIDSLPPVPTTANNELGNDLLLPKHLRKFNKYDFQIDLPYEHSYLVENLIDPAHVPISHDRTSGGGKRENAQPYEMIVDEDSFTVDGFTGKYRDTRGKTNTSWTEIKFEAPGIVRYRIELKNNILFAAALHCMPLTEGRSRLLFRTYGKGLPWFVNFLMNLKPIWLRNLNSCKILEQDVGLITTQEDWLLGYHSGSKVTISKDYLPLKSSDSLVVAYRKWIDMVGNGMPWAIGWNKIKYSYTNNNIKQAMNNNIPYDNELNNRYISDNLNPKRILHNGISPGLDIFHRSMIESRYYRHVIHSKSSKNALKNILVLKNIILFMSIGLLYVSNIIKNKLQSKVKNYD